MPGYDGHYVCKVYRQNTSLVCTIPKRVLQEEGIEKGDYIVFSSRIKGKYFEFFKYVPVGGENGRHKGSQDQ